MWRALFILGCGLFPHVVWGMQISEVAWMGTAASADDEWIELFNDVGTSISLDGWVLSFGSSSVALSGTVPAGAYVILKRSGETTAPGTAFLTYSGALANGGTTMTLKDAGGTTRDTVAAGSGWPAGDNNTKATMQRTSSGWQTAAPTPGSGALSAEAESAPAATSKSTLPSTIRPREESVSSVRAAQAEDRAVVLTAPAVAYRGQPISLTATTQGVGKQFAASLQYDWNFGDLSVGTGQDVTHTYAEPGHYVVIALAHFGSVSLVGRTTIEVRAIPLRVTQKEDGAVIITNTADYEVVLDGYTVQGVVAKTFPPHSVLLPGASVTIAAEALRVGIDSSVLLYDTGGTVVAHTGATEADVSVAMVPTAIASYTPQAKPQVAGFTFAGDEVETAPAVVEEASSTTAGAQPTTTEAPASSQSSYAYYASLAVLLMGTMGVVLKR